MLFASSHSHKLHATVRFETDPYELASTQLTLAQFGDRELVGTRQER